MKTVLITGANRGIGFEIAHQLGEKQFSVWLATEAPIQETGKFWRDKGVIAW